MGVLAFRVLEGAGVLSKGLSLTYLLKILGDINLAYRLLELLRESVFYSNYLRFYMCSSENFQTTF